jgi:sialic acid synthase SpsE/mannose-6-phosphate isomerase-like protein (cupin superfamily)
MNTLVGTMKVIDFDRLFIFEMANNHMGEVDHGLRIIREIHNVAKEFDFTFAFKFQYRNLDTFIHPDFQNRKDIKLVKRFLETRLSEEQFRTLKAEVDKLGFISVCTPFDEASVDLIEKHNYDVIKIASCSFTDWPLLERIVKTNLPLIASTAGASLDSIDKVVSFFEHRNKKFCLMHCTGEYPTKNENLQLNQINLLKKRYPGVAIGFSTHEPPESALPIQLAMARGASVFEKHVAVKTDKYGVNAYSATPEQVRMWLTAIKEAYSLCGISGGRPENNENEKVDLRNLQRGVFAKKHISKGEYISISNTFLAFPSTNGQIVANDLSKYIEYTATNDIPANSPITMPNIRCNDVRNWVVKIIPKIKQMLIDAKIILPEKVDVELSHHYGIEKFEEYGAIIINIINREYCKKLIILLPGQKHPLHYHKIKEETFHVLSGVMSITLDGVQKQCTAGSLVTVERGAMHDFSSETGVIFEEISTTHVADDSYYQDEKITTNKKRKTELTYWLDW